MDEDGLASLRAEIDRIDAAMHDLLMGRGEIIDRLVAAKRTVVSGSAFRPGREAAMMRAFAARHAGALPFEAVEAIWRVIIATFTHVQAPFAVHADASGDPAATQDAARFHFGFSVPYRALSSPGEVIAAVTASRGDLGLVPIAAAGPCRGAWWRALVPPNAPKVIARLPYVPRPDHPAGCPAVLVARVSSDEGGGERSLWAAESALDPGLLPALRGEILAAADGSTLASLPADAPPERVRAALGGEAALVGGHPAPVRLPGQPTG